MKLLVYLVLGLALLSLPSLAAELEPVAGKVDFPGNTSYQMTIDGKVIGLSDLAELPQWDIHMETRWTKEGVFRGVRLVDLLARYGRSDSYKRLTLTASNGYKIALSPETQEGMDTALVAYSLDGHLLDTDDKGPFWLLWPNEVDKLMDGEALGDVWIWGLIEIREVPWN